MSTLGPTGTSDPDAGPDGRGSILRILLFTGIAVSWAVMLTYAWTAFSTLPSPERLETSRMARIPTLDVMRGLAARSAAELAVLLALAWPAPRRYTTRLVVAVLALPVWFLATAPLTLTSVQWVHRRWLAAVWLAVSGALVITTLIRYARRVRRTAP